MQLLTYEGTSLKRKKKTGFIQQVVAIEIKIVSRRFCFKKFR